MSSATLTIKLAYREGMKNKPLQLEGFFAPAETARVFGWPSEGWYAIGDKPGSYVLGPFQSLDDCERASLSAGYSFLQS